MLTSSFPVAPEDETCGYIRDFARALSSEFQVTVLAPADKRSVRWPADTFSLHRSRSLLPASVDPFQSSRDFNSLASAGIASKLASTVSLAGFFIDALRLALKSDAIGSHWMIPSGLIGAMLARALGMPHIVVEHSGALHRLSLMKSGGLIAGFILNNSHRVVTVSSDLKMKLIALCPQSQGKVEVIPMGISVNRTRGFESRTRIETNGKRTILFVGRLSEVKGVDVLIKAATRIKNAKLIIAGDGQERSRLEELANRLSVDARFIGHIAASERDELFAACDMVVVPSRVMADGRTEGLPVVCLEAMAAGCVVVASRVGGVPEIIKHNENGFLVDADNELMLARAINRALDDDELRMRVGVSARETAARFDWSRVGPRFCKLIRQSLNEQDANIFGTTSEIRNEGY